MEKYIYRAKLDRVVDGDTVDAMIDLGFNTWVKRRIRFHGVDTWECRTRNLEEKKNMVEYWENYLLKIMKIIKLVLMKP